MNLYLSSIHNFLPTTGDWIFAFVSTSDHQNMPKRQRQTTKSSSKKKNAPPRVPDPPASLLKLLQKDKKVLKYFTALQDNLAYDVQLWKEKALDYKSKYETLTKKVPNGEDNKSEDEDDLFKSKPIKKNGENKERVEESEHVPLQSIEVPTQHEGMDNMDNEKNAEDDFDFFLENGSESDDSQPKKRKKEVINQNDNGKDMSVQDEENDSSDGSFGDLEKEFESAFDKGAQQEQEAEPIEILADANNSNDKLMQSCYRDIFEKLVKAMDDFERIGIRIVEIERLKDDSETDAIIKESLNSLSGENSPENNSQDKDIDDDSSSDEGFLGTSLASQSNNKESKAERMNDQVQLKIRRRNDDDIVFDIMHCIRSLVRHPTLKTEKTDFEEMYRPLSKEMIPLCYSDDYLEKEAGNSLLVNGQEIPCHPLPEALQDLITALQVVDTYCSSNSILSSNNSEWVKLFDDLDSHCNIDRELYEKKEVVRIGLRDRCFPQMILSSVEAEIVNKWASVDRVDRKNVDDLTNNNSPTDNRLEDIINASHQEHDFDFEKAQNKLFTIVERVCVTRILFGLHESRGNQQNIAHIIVNYIMSTLHLQEIEDWTNQTPLMSFCIIEALLIPFSSRRNAWFGSFISKLSTSEILRETLTFCIQSVVKIWYKIHSSTSNDKLRSISSVELSAYRRLLKSQKNWISPLYEFDPKTVFEQIRSDRDLDVGFCLALQLALLLKGSVEHILVKTKRYLQQMNAEHGHYPKMIRLLLLNLVNTFFRLQHVRWDTYCVKGLRVDIVQSHLDDDLHMQNVIRDFGLESIHKGTNADQLLFCEFALQLNLLSFDGLLLEQFIQSVCSIPVSDNQFQRALAQVSGRVVVRVINLNRRKDRWRQFIVQAQRMKVVSVPAVTSFLKPITFWGMKAFDGTDSSNASLEENVFGQSTHKMDNYVASHWRPCDLRPFDSNARSDEKLVRMSVTERACALSHISSWIGIKNSIEELSTNDGEKNRCLSLFRISGFASGPAMLKDNENMPPSPVCIVLEDDAILIDQFNEKLSSILKELPRDFHFCSLGYR